MKLTRTRLKEIIKEELLSEIQLEAEDIQDMEASIFDVIIEFKKNFEKSDWKKNRKINSKYSFTFKWNCYFYPFSCNGSKES